jgi:ABC-type glycerol-3-phosphate transport system substrate-binding protein
MAPGSGVGIPPEALQGVKIQVWMPWFGVDTQLFESQVNDFNSSNQWGITVEAVSQQNYTELYDNVTSALATPDKPQLAIALPEQAIGWDKPGQVVDLTRYIHDPEYGLTASEIADFPAAFWSQDELGTRRLAMPAQRTARVMLYNAGWAQELGFNAPPKTPGDFRQQACRAHQSMLADSDRKNDAQGGWLVDDSAPTFLSWMSAFGGGILDTNGNYQFLTPKNLSAITYVKQLYDESCAWMAAPDSDPAAAFAARKALFATAALEDLPDYSRAMGSAGNSDEWTVLPFPGQDGGTIVVYGSSYVILKSTPEQQLASWLFVRWLLSPENQKKWVEVTGMLPLRTSVLSLLGDYQKSHPQWTEAVALIPQAQGVPRLASWRSVGVMIGDGFDAMFRSNTPAGRVAEVLAIMQNTARDLTR